MNGICRVCGYCPCCGKKGASAIDSFSELFFPKRVAELKEHYEIFPEHKEGHHSFETNFNPPSERLNQ